MVLAKVVGKIVATTKNEGLNGKKILVVAPMDMDGEIIGKEFVSLDSVGAGIGDYILVTEGTVSRYAFDGDMELPIDSAIVAIIDVIEKN